MAGIGSFGKAFESWVHHELQAYRAYHDLGCELAFYSAARSRTA